MIMEIRTYRLNPGTRADFVRLMRTEGAAVMARHGLTVVDCGASLADEDGHEEAYLIRAFPSLRVREEQEAEFYGSEDWLRGPREAIVAPIESYHTIVLEVPETAVRALTPSR